MAPLQYLYLGLHGHGALVPYMWLALVLNVSTFILFIVPGFRHRTGLLNVGCVFVLIGVYIEKGIGLVVPGFTPDVLGEIYEYVPSTVELSVAAGIWAAGALLYTLLAKFAIPVFIKAGEFTKMA
jgi:molybdopterin-containing oxidoreductase family membrane subunit